MTPNNFIALKSAVRRRCRWQQPAGLSRKRTFGISRRIERCNFVIGNGWDGELNGIAHGMERNVALRAQQPDPRNAAACGKPEAYLLCADGIKLAHPSAMSIG